MSEETIVEFKDVCFAYEKEEVLHNVDLNIKKDSLVAVVGPNGGGKSTIIKLILGLLKPNHGILKVFGSKPEKVHQQIGYVPQYLNFDHNFPVSVLDVVLMGRAERHWIGPYRRKDREIAMQALCDVQIENLYKQNFAKLSGGQRQRVLIAQALVTQPNLILLDEPTANVDNVIEHGIYELLHKLNENMTIVVVSHNLNVVTRYATHIACVNRTASLMPMQNITDAKLNAVFRGDMTILQHEESCHVIDPSTVMQSPHHACACNEKNQ